MPQSRPRKINLVSREEGSPKCSLQDVKNFESSHVWHDIQLYIEHRLQENFRVLIDLNASNEKLRILQASTTELYELLELPQFLRHAVETEIDRQVQEIKRENKNVKQR